MNSTSGLLSRGSFLSRRCFLGEAATVLLAPAALLRSSKLAAQATRVQAAPPATPTRPDVAAIDHDRILTAAELYLAQAPTPLTALPCPRSPGTIHDYYSEAETEPSLIVAPASKGPPPPDPFTAHRDALFAMGLAVPALTAAHLLTGEQRYADHAVVQLRAWFVDPATRMTPRLDYGSVLTAQAAPSADDPQSANETEARLSARPAGRFQGILETVPLVEVAQSIPFLAASGALADADLKAVQVWFADYLRWLTQEEDSGPRLPALARDRKDHHGTSWLLQACAFTALTAPTGDVSKSEDSALGVLRHRYRSVTLRAQIGADGTFPHELTSATPYRDSLFNLDMLAGICVLLSTRFDSLWEYELQDGPGMRSAIAFHFPFIADRGLWPYRSDATHFSELPARRNSLLFTAAAYQRPEYAAVWKRLPPDPASPDILRTLPIHQPLLWVRQPKRTE